jgi:hypothetical protein
MNTATPNTASASTGKPVENKQILLKDIGAKWSKFSEQELIARVVAKYSMGKTQAQRDVDAVMKGRQL